MLFRAGPGFQPPAGIAKIEVRHGIRRAFLQTGLKGRARLLVLLLFQEFGARSKFLGLFVKQGRGHRRISIEAEHRNKYEDLSHQPPSSFGRRDDSSLDSKSLIGEKTIYLTHRKLNPVESQTRPV